MPRYIVKQGEFYYEWSTVVDAPVSFGQSREDFEVYYQSRYGTGGMSDLPDRMERVEAKGTSAFNYESAEALLSFNRAGPNEVDLTFDEIYQVFCLRQPIRNNWIMDDTGIWHLPDGERPQRKAAADEAQLQTPTAAQPVESGEPPDNIGWFLTGDTHRVQISSRTDGPAAWSYKADAQILDAVDYGVPVASYNVVVVAVGTGPTPLSALAALDTEIGRVRGSLDVTFSDVADLFESSPAT